MEVEVELEYEHEINFENWTVEAKLDLIREILENGKHCEGGTTSGTVEVDPPERDEGHY